MISKSDGWDKGHFPCQMQCSFLDAQLQEMNPVQLTERLVWEREQAYLKKVLNWLVSASGNEKWRC